MADLTTKYLGLDLKNPIIVGSCSLTSNIEDIVRLEQAGAAAVVLKSIFEEEILREADSDIDRASKSKLIYSHLSETFDYIDLHAKEKRLTDYLKLIRECKSKTLIPIIASINCVSDSQWIEFASKIQAAGADALELNISMSPLDESQQDKEKAFLMIIKKVLKTVDIPISIKVSERFSNLPHTLLEFSESGISGLVLFNQFYNPDIDIDHFSLVQGRMHSSDTDYLRPLRWIALMSDRIKCSLAASSGIHDANTIIKMILAGADAVQIVSALYMNGNDYLNHLLNDLDKWMNLKGIFSVDQFKGKASYTRTTDPAVYERIQFMKYYGRIGDK
jgi:dihydroorotate dehydrogenase (fumarate)